MGEWVAGCVVKPPPTPPTTLKFFVKRCASANKPFLAGEHHMVQVYADNTMVHPPFISLLVIGGNEARPQYLQYAICDASWSTGACILRSSEHHSRNDSSSSSSTSWSHDVHVFSHIRTRYFSEGSVQQHPPPR